MSSAAMNVNAQLEHLQSKHVGTGHADTNKFEWVVNQHRDTYASIIGHNTLLAYASVAENESMGRKKFEMVEKMLQPCGLPVPRDD
ncbi:splicing factor 3B subunit 5/RDS3 complex subunit 10 [Fimicolochytrium jonesii]|uniref:splicing factor 3B subunit 5/RDS3 complex subunit 10 n=1 Tax=Fimicolochytrium jonesii TaxID=1396493 RepID=UPI0022FE11E4|nr:splicing factor 3B subunit 5/RDS3 complex subunit 10 [Fimicolochytrium jonesii]KAI8826855.1 splicing factor 3B subunit 5/RDS3 complex subunit 10 [Fimicolochytrium jonesii]